MRFVIQRVKSAKLMVAGKEISSINKGLLVLVGVCKDDDYNMVIKSAQKIANMRIFEENNKLNKSVIDNDYEVLLVSNFTLCTKESSGARPDFGLAKDAKSANEFYLSLKNELQKLGVKVKLGAFGEDMQIETILDGPITIYKEIK